MNVTTAPPIRTIADQVCHQLRGELLAGAFPPGMPLREEELATRFGVSRHPIRKALQNLTLEGLLIAKPNCGVVVAAPQTEHVEGLLTPLRVQLEIYALRRAFPLLNDTHRAAWTTILRRMARACEDDEPQAILDQDAALHQRLLIVAGLDGMIPLWQSIYSRMRDYHRQGNAKLSDARYIAFGHERLITSLFAGNLERAAADWQSHLENGAFNAQALADYQLLQAKPKKKD